MEIQLYVLCVVCIARIYGVLIVSETCVAGNPRQRNDNIRNEHDRHHQKTYGSLCYNTVKQHSNEQRCIQIFSQIRKPLRERGVQQDLDKLVQHDLVHSLT